jgi:fatty acid-binding protein DegV
VKRKISEKLEQLNKAKEQIEAIQKEIDEMKEQENSSLWQESLHQNPAPARESPKENFFAGNGVSHFVDSESPLSMGCKQHLGRRSSSLSLFPNTTASKTPGSFS